MKKAEQWAYENQNTIHSIADVIRMAQEEAIHETVKRCADSAKVRIALYKNKETGFTSAERIIIDKDSILKVEPKMIKEL